MEGTTMMVDHGERGILPPEPSDSNVLVLLVIVDTHN